tara:strand:- start:105 stop:1268 length:1164 start_codon:yes stop_codon:yes gene_type:complete
MFRTNTNNIKILSPNGFSNFNGIQKVERNLYQHIIFDDDTEIKTSINHPFGKDKILARDVKVGDYLNSKKVLYNELVNENIFLYDPINVEKESLYITNGVVSHNCEFLGSVDTLINAQKLKTMAVINPRRSPQGLDVYEMPIKDHTYVITVDVARGIQNDYSAFIVIDATKAPYKIVAKYRNNDIKPIVFPNVLDRIGKLYNKAYILIEINDLGQQVADSMQFELEYDNMMMVTQRGRAGQVLGGGFSGRGNQLGVRMTKGTKKIGTSNLKSLIEGDKLIINDFDIISELSTFISKGKSFEAETGSHDDLVMCLVIFSWLANQRYFKELTNVDVRGQMFTDQKNAIEADMAPFGFIDDGINDPEGNDGYFADAGELWQPVTYRKGEN